jgi:uncharacterized beta-barrel protein YwiB (DUF1934 family)
MSDNYTISILGRQESDGEDDEVFELVTEGEYALTGGVAEFSYRDSSVTGSTGATRFRVEPDRVTMTRGAWFGGDMIFQEAYKHHFLYETPLGALTMGIDTHSLKLGLGENGGKLQIRYDIDVDNVVISRNTFDITIKN